jgi:hypothetical protein
MRSKSIKLTRFELLICVFLGVNFAFLFLSARYDSGVTAVLGAFFAAFLSFVLLLLLVKVIIRRVKKL